MQKKPSPTENQPGLHQVKFSNIELDVLKVLYRNSLKNTDTTQEELNQLLGLSSKKLSIQKKYRNDIIVSVNQKWMIGQNTTDTLIERKRSSEDKRIYHYAITQQFLDELAGLFPDKNSPNPGTKRPPGM